MVRSFRVGAEDAELRIGNGREVGVQGEHLFGAGQPHGGPAGSVVGPLVVEDLGAVNAEGGCDLGDVSFVERTRAQAIGGGEGEGL